MPPMYQKALKQWVVLLYFIVVTYVKKNTVIPPMDRFFEPMK